MKATDETRARWQKRLDLLESILWPYCTESEIAFIESVSISLEQGRDLTPKQAKKMLAIYRNAKRRQG